MRKWRFILLLITIIILIPASTSLAETETKTNIYSTPRPKIGLALGGGSAGGFAHIGVLTWLEEHHIPVDYLAGTSMGGLMGGCYATGMSPSEIKDLVKSIRWNELFNPNPPFSAMDFRRKEDVQDFPILEIGYRNGSVRLPSGLGVYRIDLILSRIAFPYPAPQDFAQLPIPFKCVATDIQNYQSVVFENGSLKEALRATMAIPGVFTPVVYDGQVLVDGGILNNVPVEVAKKMGADIVIAVNIAAPVQRRDFESIDTVLGKTIDTVLATNSGQSLQSADVVLAPSFSGLGLLNWDAAEQYIALGYQAADKARDTLERFALSPEAWEKYLLERKSRRKAIDLIPAAILVEGASDNNASNIQEQCFSLVDKPFDPLLLEDKLTELMGSGLYESLSYEFTQENGQTILKIKVKEKTYGPPFIRFGLYSEASGISTDNYNLNLGTRLTSFNIAGPGSELRMDLELGTESAFKLELYKPLLKHGFFIAPALFITSNNYSHFIADDRVSDYRLNESGIRLDTGYSPDKNSEFRLGWVTEHQSDKIKVGDALPESLTGTVNYAEFQWTYHFSEELIFPGKSLWINVRANHYFSTPGQETQFNLGEAKLRWINPISATDSLLTIVAAGVSDGELPLPQQFKLGGPFRLSAYSFDQFEGDNYILGTIGYLKLISKWSKHNKVYAGFWLENGSVFDSWSDPDLTMDLSAGLFTSTFLGPLTIGCSIGEDSNQTLFVALGHIF